VAMNTPLSLLECKSVQLTWSQGSPPYFLSIQDGNNPTGAPLLSFGQQTGTSLTWVVNFQAGTSIGFLLRDSTGETAQTASVVVQAGSSSSCLNGS
ncbi:hypothetical protein L218DRAFT_806800, partial [Marasmius fiardii PR-910]